MNRIRTAALALAISAGSATAALAAGEISQDALNADRKACGTACSSKGQDAAFCSSYCDCTVKGIGDQLSLEEYRGIAEAAEKQQPAPAPALDKLQKITSACRNASEKPAN